MPLAVLPLVLAALADALVALGRISTFLRAEELAIPYTIDPSSTLALNVDGDFTWEAAKKGDTNAKFLRDDKKEGDKEKTGESQAEEEKGDGPILPTSDLPKNDEKEPEENKAEDEKPFELKDLNLQIPKGAFVAIVGPVASGKVRCLVIVAACSLTRSRVLFCRRSSARCGRREASVSFPPQRRTCRRRRGS